MGSLSIALASLTLNRLPSCSSLPLVSTSSFTSVVSSATRLPICPWQNSVAEKKRDAKYICRAAEYKFPDPIPEFADAETDKFRTHLVKKLMKKEVCGDSLDDVVGICTEIFNTFLHTEYGGPGTLLVLPFIDMADTINDRGLPGGPQAARAAIKWAQDNVDKDWKEWNGGEGN